MIATGERFYREHAPRAVLSARWLPGLRLAGVWFSGLRMPVRVFLVWNVVHGVSWAFVVSLLASRAAQTAGIRLGVFGPQAVG